MERIYLHTEDWQLSLPKKDLQHAQRSSSCEAYVISTTSGYFLSILGPYLADSKNSDAAIHNHVIAKNVDTIRQWVKDEDVMVYFVDRGFRDSLQVLEDLGIKAQMPSFLKKGDKQ